MSKIQKNSTSYPGHEKRKTTPIHDQIQIALALADQQSLINLLLNSKPPIVSFNNRNIIEQALIDQALKEISRYALRDSGKNPLEWKVTKNKVQEPFWKKITCEAEVPIPRKNYAVDAIIHYGYEHKVEIEIRHKSSGEILGYNWPIGESGKILVEIKTEIQSWADTLRQIKRYQNELQIPKSILVCDTLTELEAQGFINQGISIYPAINLTLPIYADCSICIHVNCPMSGTQNSPVTRCIDFDTIDGWMSKNKQIEGKEF